MDHPAGRGRDLWKFYAATEGGTSRPTPLALIGGTRTAQLGAHAEVGHCARQRTHLELAAFGQVGAHAGSQRGQWLANGG